MRGHYYNYGLGGHSNEKTKTVEESAEAEAEKCARQRELAEVNRARIQNGKHPDYKNGKKS